MTRILFALALAFLTLTANAATLGSAPCTRVASNIACGPIPNDAGKVIELQRYVVPQVYLGNGQYQAAYTLITVTVDGTDYTTQPNAFGVSSVKTGTYDADETWTFTAYSDGGLPLVGNVLVHSHRGVCSGRGCRVPYTYGVVGGSLQ